MHVSTGTRLGPYEIVSRIGAGGMGEVWRARDTRLDRDVAVKILPAEFEANAQLSVRFEREARLISQLAHPHICTLFDVGQNYLVMELLDGETLADRLARGALPLPDVLEYGAQIAEALDRAHRAGVVHRDLKPANIMLTRAGAKLLDFGLAKASAVVPGGARRVDAAPTPGTEQASASGDLPGETVQKPLTREGTIVGTFQYMAPEQLEGTEADARTDIFAFGAVLYEMTTGRRAFDGRTRTSLIAAIVKDQPPPLSEMQPLTPPALEHVITNCLKKDPDDRWQSAHDVADQLRWIRTSGSQVGVPSPIRSHRRSRRWAMAAALALAIAAIAAAVTLSIADRRPVPVYSFTIPRADGPYTRASVAIISPDGTQVAFSASPSPENPRQIFVRSLSSFDARALAGTDDVSFPRWSSDGRSILFMAGGQAKVVDVRTGAIRAVTDAGDVLGFAMNAEGEILLGSSRSGIRRMAVNGTRSETITTPDRARHEVYHSFPSFLPDGRRFFFLALVRDPSRRDQPHLLYAGTLGSREVRLVGEVPSQVAYVASGHLLFVRDGTLLAVRFDDDSLEMTGDPEPIVEDVFYFQPTGRAHFSVSQTGVITYQEASSGESLIWVDRTGRAVGSIGSVGLYGAFRITRDGASVIADVTNRKLGTPDLWNLGLRRETAERMTFTPGFESAPVSTPDGSRLFYSTDRAGVPDIYVRAAGSGGDDQPFVVAPGMQYPTDVSPDGRFLIYETSETPQNRRDLYVIPVDGSGKGVPFVRTPFNEFGARFSPDGRWVAYESDQSGITQVYVRPFEGSGEARQVSTKWGTLPRWSPDGRELYFRDWTRVYAASVPSDTEPSLLFETARSFDWFEVAPDGERFLLAMTDDVASQNPTRVIIHWQELLRQRRSSP